jgi:uncharacterized protein
VSELASPPLSAWQSFYVIVGSTDLLAVDKASVDLVYALPDPERRDIIERIESRSGLHQLEYMKTLRMGNDQYELITA